MWKDVIKDAIQKTGFALTRYDPRYHPIARQWHVLRRVAPTLVLDVGANEGEFAQELRTRGFQGRIISFEPRVAAYAALRARMEKDPAWVGYPCGLGESDETASIHVSGNTASSSVLPMQELHVSALPGSQTQRTESISIRSLDSLRGELALGADERILLKLDVQGYEMRVLHGARSILPLVQAMLVELSLQPLYQGAPLMEDLMAALRREGFTPVGLVPVFGHPENCHLLQMDGLFIRQP